MAHYPYLIVGGGMTAAGAIRGIREVDETKKIGVVGKEQEKPYTRPLLSKGLWKGKSLDDVWQKVDFPEVEFHLGRTAKTLHPDEHRILDDQENEYTYDQLLLATGGKPRRLPFGGDNILYYRTLQDYFSLRKLSEEKQRIAIIGGGFIGSELAAALCEQGNTVLMFFPERGISARVFPSDLSNYVTEYFREKGVEIHDGVQITDVKTQGESLSIHTDGGGEFDVDAVVAGIGITLNTSLAEEAGLTIENGIAVNEHLQTSSPDIYAAGDVASFFNPALNTRLRVEHEDNALKMGKTAGRIMAGDRTPYHYLPFFYSDLFDLGYEAVGDLSSDLQVLEDWVVPYKKGAVFYLRDGRVRGVLLWNVWDKVDAAREVISRPGPMSEIQLRGLLTI